MSDQWLYGWALGYAAVGAASLLIPLYALTLGGGPLLVGVLASTAAFAGVPGAILWGRFAARTKRRRPFILVALGATALVLAGTPLIASPWPLVVANAALWFVIAAAAPVLNLIMVEGAAESEWESRIGLLNSYQGYGWVAGLLVGTVWTGVVPTLLDPALAQELLFWILATGALLGLAVVRLRYPEQSVISERRFRRIYRRLDIGPTTGRVVRSVPLGPGRAYWALTGIRRDHLTRLRSPLLGYLSVTALFSVGFAMFWAPMPAFLTATGFTTSAVFVLFLLANVGSAAAFGRVGSVSSRLGTDDAQVSALTARIVLFPLVAVVGGLTAAVRTPLLGGLFLAIGVSWAVIAVTATGVVTRLAPVNDRAEALGLYTAAVGVGTGIGSIAGGILADGLGYRTTFVLAGGVVLVGTGLVAVLLRRRSAQSPDVTEDMKI